MDFQVRLCDFGLSVSNAPCYRNVHTWLFCPPEILKEKRAYCKSDCWAAGVVMFVLLSGFFPFHSMSGTMSELKKRIKDGPSFVLSRAPLSRDAKDLLSKLLDVDPTTRIGASDAMKHDWFLVANDDTRHSMIVDSLKQLSRAPPIGVKTSSDSSQQATRGTCSPVFPAMSPGEEVQVEVSRDVSGEEMLEHPITTTQIFFTHRLGEVEDIFG
jgi:serine/threonine protein kinase